MTSLEDSWKAIQDALAGDLEIWVQIRKPSGALVYEFQAPERPVHLDDAVTIIHQVGDIEISRS